MKRKEAQRSGGLHGTQWRKTGDTASAREGRRPLGNVRVAAFNFRDKLDRVDAGMRALQRFWGARRSKRNSDVRHISAPSLSFSRLA